MGEDTGKKIQEAIKNLGYHPNHLARSLKQKRTSMIGLILANIQANFILANNHQSTYNAIGHFIENGHNQIAIVTQPLTITTRKERIEGYKKALLAWDTH